jgi:hypothetical protein
MGRYAHPPRRKRDANGAGRFLQAQRGMGIFSLLHEEGRRSAQLFLETHALDLGRRSTLDIDVLLQNV